MNRIFLVIVALIIPCRLFGQMFPLSDHYLYNFLSINPAFAGCHDALSATMSYRNQWVGIKDAPKNLMMSIHAPTDNDRVGLGLLVDRSTIGIFKETNLMADYAYRIPMGDGKLALGLGVGVTVLKNSWNELLATDPNDAELINSSPSAILPAFSLGMYYYTKKYFIGISLPSILSNEPDNSTIGAYKIKNNPSNYNYFFTGGYEFEITDQFKLLPSAVIKYHPNNAVQIDYNAQLNLKDRIWLGAGYRDKNILIGMFQCQLNYQIRMAYSYDFDIGKIGKYNNGSHEIVLSYVFKYARKVIGPRQY